MYFTCNICGTRATVHVSELGVDDVHLCEPCVRGTVAEAAWLPRPRPGLINDLLAAYREIYAEELRGPTLAEMEVIVGRMRPERWPT